jgi:ketosteroid isomerase-like protein
MELVRQMYDAFRGGDAEAALRCFDADVVMDASHRVDGRVGRGHHELVAILSEWMGTWDGWREDVEEMHDAGDRVLVVSTQSGRGKGSKVDWHNRFAMLYEFRSGKISRWTVYDDPAKAFEACGLDE